MFCTCRATVCSLMTSSDAIVPVALAGRDQPEHLELAGREPVCLASARRRRQRVDARQVGPCPELLEDAAGGLRARASPYPRPRARGTPPPSVPAPARSRTGPRAPARPATACRKETTAARGSPSASSTAPRPCAPWRRASRPRSAAAISCSSSQQLRASSSAPSASMISTNAGSSPARPSGAVSRRASRRIAAAAASALPCASRKSASPGCGSEPYRLASR